MSGEFFHLDSFICYFLLEIRGKKGRNFVERKLTTKSGGACRQRLLTCFVDGWLDGMIPCSLLNRWIRFFFGQHRGDMPYMRLRGQKITYLDRHLDEEQGYVRRCQDGRHALVQPKPCNEGANEKETKGTEKSINKKSQLFQYQACDRSILLPVTTHEVTIHI